MGSRVLLVNTNRMQPPVAPVALDYLAAALRAHGHKPRLLDLCWSASDSDLAEALADAPDLVALTFRNSDDCYWASGASFVGMLREDVARVRAHFEGPVLLGGAGYTLFPTLLLELTGANYGIRGDGEPGLLGLLSALAGSDSLENVPGLVWKGDAEWRCASPGRPDLGQFALARRDFVDNTAYFARGGQIGLETKRGCPGRCIYCADPVIKGSRVRLRQPAEVVQEIRHLLDQGIFCFHLCDSEFNLPPDHAAAICQALMASGLGEKIRWYAYAAPSPFDRTLAHAMRRAGCVGIDFGVDSGSPRMLRALGRDFGPAELRATARACREAGLVFMFDLLLGAPGETASTVRETVALMKEISPDRVGVSLGVRVYPGTPLAHALRSGAVSTEGLVGRLDSVDPCFYLSPHLGSDPLGLVRELIGADRRFFLPGGNHDQDYNYNDNRLLCDAIRRGHRGAYWDILRRCQEGLPPLG